MPERKNRASTSSEERLNTSTPRAGSHTRPVWRIGPMSGVPSGVSTGPVVDGEDVAIVSFDDIRWRGGENGADSFVSFGDWRGEELADGPIPGDADGFGEPASLLVGI